MGAFIGVVVVVAVAAAVYAAVLSWLDRRDRAVVAARPRPVTKWEPMGSVLALPSGVVATGYRPPVERSNAWEWLIEWEWVGLAPLVVDVPQYT